MKKKKKKGDEEFAWNVFFPLSGHIYIFYPNENERLTKLRLSSFWSILTITDK